MLRHLGKEKKSNADGINIAREKYYNSNETFDHGEPGFGLSGLFKAGLDPIEQFVGSYKYTITDEGTYLRYTIRNNTSFGSASYHVAPSAGWEGGPMGNYYQIYTFTEPIRK